MMGANQKPVKVTMTLNAKDKKSPKVIFKSA